MKAILPTAPTSSMQKRLAGRVVRFSVIERTLVRVLSWIPADVLTRDRYFRLFERKGIHVTPVRWDQPVSDIREHGEDLWSARPEVVWFDLDVEGQPEILPRVN